MTTGNENLGIECMIIYCFGFDRWKQHQFDCGGTFKKIKEPEDYVDKKRKKGKCPCQIFFN
jgi:hypothetical protein